MIVFDITSNVAANLLEIYGTVVNLSSSSSACIRYTTFITNMNAHWAAEFADQSTFSAVHFPYYVSDFFQRGSFIFSHSSFLLLLLLQ